MSEVVIFENAGEIDPRLISTFGVNVKEGEGAIGFFGTGLKYALAILVRSGHVVTIQSGETVHTFGVQRATIRGKDFEFVTMNGEPMGFTTEVGKQWKLWMAYRELFCNCQDEGGTVYEAASLPDPEAGKTRVIVSGDEFAKVRRDHHLYFITGTPVHTGKTCQIHDGPGHGIYYRGVLVGCADGGEATLYTYNLTTQVELTEDRTAKHGFMLSFRIAEALLKCDDPGIIREVVTAPKGTHEHGLSFDWDHVKPGQTFLTVVGDLLRKDFASVNSSARQAWEKHARIESEPDAYQPDAFEQVMLDRAMAFCQQFGFEVGDYQVVIVQSMGPGVLGMAKGQKIYIARTNFDLGVKQLACTLIEEFIHLRHKVPDCSRPMQEFLLNRLVTVGERLTGEPL